MSNPVQAEYMTDKYAALQKMLETIADLTGTPKGAYNIRVDGKSIGRQSTQNIEIRPKEQGKGCLLYTSRCV